MGASQETEMKMAEDGANLLCLHAAAPTELLCPIIVIHTVAL